MGTGRGFSWNIRYKFWRIRRVEMGLMDILNGIDLKDIAMGMAVASQGNTAVPNVINILDKRRAEEEVKAKNLQTSKMLDELYSNPALFGQDKSMDLISKQQQVNAMPDTIPEYSNELPVDPATGLELPVPQATGQEILNPEKAKAQANFIVDVAGAQQQLPNMADAIAQIGNKYPDIDADVKVKVYSALYGQRESLVKKYMDIAEKQQARIDTAREKQQSREDKRADNLIKKEEPYKIGHREKVIIGDKEVYQEYLGNGQWKEVSGIGGPRYKPGTDKPEYTPKQALARISAIDGAIARITNSGKIDIATAILNPSLAATAGSQDPETIKAAITSLQNERKYIADFAPRGTVAEIKINPVRPQSDRLSPAIDFLKKSVNEEDAIKRAKQLKAKGWTREDLNKAGEIAGY
jgi:hypothetical protein